MERAFFTTIVRLARSLSIPERSGSWSFTEWTGSFFSNNEICNLFGRRLVENSKNSIFADSLLSKGDREIQIQTIRSSLEKLSEEQKFTLYIQFYLYCCDPVNGSITPSLNECLNVAAGIFDIDENDKKNFDLFFSYERPFIDKEKAIYFKHTDANPLISATGLNVCFCCNNADEIYYLKYFQKYNVFVSRKFTTYRQANSLLETITPKELDVFSKTYKPEAFGKCGSYSALVKSVSSFFPLQTVTSTARDNAPSIFLDAACGKLTISGYSSPLSPLNYFQPVYDWMNLYAVHGGEHLEVRLQLEYFNSYTTRFILNLALMCVSLSAQGKDIDFYWYCTNDDEESFEFGKHLKNVCKKEFSVQLVRKKIETGV